NFGDNTLSVLLGDGVGYPAPTAIGVGSGPTWVDVADMNGDGLLDLVSANYSASNLSVSLGNGLGNFGPPTSSSAGGQAYAVALADLNKDGDTDAVVTVPAAAQI